MSCVAAIFKKPIRQYGEVLYVPLCFGISERQPGLICMEQHQRLHIAVKSKECQWSLRAHHIHLDDLREVLAKWQMQWYFYQTQLQSFVISDGSKNLDLDLELALNHCVSVLYIWGCEWEDSTKVTLILNSCVYCEKTSADLLHEQEMIGLPLVDGVRFLILSRDLARNLSTPTPGIDKSAVNFSRFADATLNIHCGRPCQIVHVGALGQNVMRWMHGKLGQVWRHNGDRKPWPPSP